MRKAVLIAVALAALLWAGGYVNVIESGFRIANTATWRFPERLFSQLPAAAAGNVGWRYTITDAATSACSAGSGAIKCDVRSDGSSWVVISGGGGGFSQVNSLAGGGSTAWQRLTDCAVGSVTLAGGTFTTSPVGTTAAASSSAATQEFTIITALSGLQRYDHLQISEGTIFTTASGTVTGLRASIGRPGASTNDELLPQNSLMQSSGNAWFWQDRPQPPTLNLGAYTLVVALRLLTSGTDKMSALTAGSLNYEVCGFAAQ